MSPKEIGARDLLQTTFDSAWLADGYYDLHSATAAVSRSLLSTAGAELLRQAAGYGDCNANARGNWHFDISVWCNNVRRRCSPLQTITIHWVGRRIRHEGNI